MKKIYSLSIILMATMLCIMASCQQGEDHPVITIIHTNDTHSQIEPATNKDGTVTGGVVERASLLDYFRKQDPDLLYLDAGDMVQGSPFFNIFNGILEMYCMNQQDLICSTFGNHEFDNGLAGLDSMLRIADFPFVSCNYHCDSTIIADLIQPHLIVENHGVKIGLTGVTCDPEGLIFAKNWAGIRYEDPVIAANREAKILRDKGCDLVVLLSHVGYSTADTIGDRLTALKSSDIDIIIGGHTHTNLEEGVYVNNMDGTPVLITQTGSKQAPIGYVQVTMKRGSRYPKCHYSVDSIVCHKLYPADYDLTGCGQDMKDFIAPYLDQLQSMMQEKIGFSASYMDRGRPQSLLGNFTADAIRAVGASMYDKPIDVGLMNVGGLRNDMPAGDVSLGDLYKIYPFENSFEILELKGSDLDDLIHSMAGKKLEALSGVNVTLALEDTKAVAKEVLVGGKPIDPERTYVVATIDYLAEGNDGMSALTRYTKRTKTGIILRDCMIDYVKSLTAKGQEINAMLDNRVVDNAKGATLPAQTRL